MKEKIPHCPNCKTANYVVLDKSATRTGTALGGLLGVGAAYSAKKAVVDPTIKAFMPRAGPPLIVVTDLLLAILAGFSAGAATGMTVGEQIDTKLRINYRCNACGATIRG